MFACILSLACMLAEALHASMVPRRKTYDLRAHTHIHINAFAHINVYVGSKKIGTMHSIFIMIHVNIFLFYIMTCMQFFFDGFQRILAFEGVLLG